MSRLSQLHVKLNHSPSLLPIEDEVFLASELMTISIEEIIDDQALFFDILDQLETSHTTGLGYLNKSVAHRGVFARFAAFLDGLAVQLPSQSAWLAGTASAFRLTNHGNEAG
jgi:hypothetical protein